MRDMIKDIFASPIPVVIYVSPAGARAASAGALLSLAAHVAAMTPGTNIGAAHPVSIGGGGEVDETMKDKITNDAAAYARSLATKRGRNVDWAERVVRESISSTAEEAFDSNVVDIIANSLDELLEQIHGRSVEVGGEQVVIVTAGAEVIEMKPTTRERFLGKISDPNIAYLLMLVGIFGLIFEFQNPGTILPGVVGVIALFIAAFALQLLPVNYVGLGLILLAMVLFILEAKVTSGGVLAIGGVVSMVIGSVMLIESPLPFMKVSWTVIIPSVLFTALFFLVAVGLGIRAQGGKVTTGSKGIIGEQGVARAAINPTGKPGSVFVHGEHWNAYSDHEIPEGASVVVESVDGMRLKVKVID
jgi:membrane-bound serine protease (ClpP class)